jgi:serine/threonine-protein kinase
MAEIGPGHRVGPYRLGHPLRESGMGVSFRAVRESDGLVVALKILRPELSRDETFRRRFVRDARSACEVHHRHLVSIVEVGEDEGRAYLATAFVYGRTLEDVLRNESLQVADAVRIVTEIGSGLDALHRAGIVHRDVKPSNVMVDDEDGSAALTDFGLAKGRAYTVLTGPGIVMGTLHYLAPELLSGEEATTASDVYALGCVAFECIAGHPPFGERSMYELANAHVAEDPPDLRAARPDVAEGVSWAIQQALSKDPAERPPSGTALANLLEFGSGRDAQSP